MVLNGGLVLFSVMNHIIRAWFLRFDWVDGGVMAEGAVAFPPYIFIGDYANLGPVKGVSTHFVAEHL